MLPSGVAEMRKIAAISVTAISVVCLGAVAAVIVLPRPAAAFGLSVGPFHIGLPLFGSHHFAHRRHIALRHSEHGHEAQEHEAREASVYDNANLDRTETARQTEPAQFAEPALLYPVVALPNLYDAIFWPDRSQSWPFGYDSIFRSAFAKSPLDDDQRACQQRDRTAEILGRIRAEVKPRPDQLPLLQKLGEALGMAGGYLARACPKAIPAQPVARLQLMQSQQQALGMAIDLVRPPLQRFEDSLDASQKARFDAASANASACAAAAPATDWSVDEIDQAVMPGDSQNEPLADLKQAFASAAADLHAHCPNPLPPTPLARLEAMESRIDASWRAALSMQTALASFESRLNDQQRSRFESLNLAQAR
jgi:LTXXQ motif family protein